MPVIQVSFDVPPDIWEKIVSGEYRGTGLVVRNAAGPRRGKIVKNCKPVNQKVAEQVQTVKAKALQYLKDNKKGIAIGAGIGIVVLASVSFYVIHHRSKTREPQEVTELREAMQKYLTEGQQGKLTLETITGLIASLDNIKEYTGDETIMIELSAEDFEIMVRKIYDHTIRLAELNKINLTEEESHPGSNSIQDLQRHLMTQKRIFETAA